MLRQCFQFHSEGEESFSARSSLLKEDCQLPCHSRSKTVLHHLLGLERHFRPAFVERTGANLLREIPEHIRLLCRWMIVAVGGNSLAAPIGFNTEFGTGRITFRLADLEHEIAS